MADELGLSQITDGEEVNRMCDDLGRRDLHGAAQMILRLFRERNSAIVLAKKSLGLSNDRQRRYEAEADRCKQALSALSGLVNYAEAVRVSAGMGPNQLKRLEVARALLATTGSEFDQ